MTLKNETGQANFTACAVEHSDILADFIVSSEKYASTTVSAGSKTFKTTGISPPSVLQFFNMVSSPISLFQNNKKFCPKSDNVRFNSLRYTEGSIL